MTTFPRLNPSYLGREPTIQEADRLLFEACAATGEDLRDTLTATSNNRARAYAFQAIRKLFDGDFLQLAKMVGGRGTQAATSYLRTAHEKGWFDPNILARVAQTVAPDWQPPRERYGDAQIRRLLSGIANAKAAERQASRS